MLLCEKDGFTPYFPTFSFFLIILTAIEKMY